MKFYKTDFPQIIPDNDEIYLEHLKGVIESVDEFASAEVVRTPNSYKFRIVPSTPRYTQLILHEITKINTLFGIHLELSKSIRASSTIMFNIKMLK